MNRLIGYSASILALALVFSATAVAGNAGIAKQAGQWQKHFNAGNAAGVAAIYTEGGVLLPPDSANVEGREAIEAFWQGYMDQVPGAQVTLESEEIFEMGGKAVEVGTFSASDGGYGKFMVIWEKTDDGWLMARDIWNSSVPLAQGE